MSIETPSTTFIIQHNDPTGRVSQVYINPAHIVAIEHLDMGLYKIHMSNGQVYTSRTMVAGDDINTVVSRMLNLALVRHSGGFT